MRTVEAVRDGVEAFRLSHMPVTPQSENAFTPWFIARNFRVAWQVALAQSGDGRNYDGGIDGYYLEKSATPPLLSLIQAKFTDADGEMRKGVADLCRAVNVAEQILSVGPTTMVKEHGLIGKLREDLLSLPEDERCNLEVKCILIHLTTEQEYMLAKPSMQKAKQEFMDAVADGVLAGRVRLLFEGPTEMLRLDGEVVARPAPPINLRFNGVAIGTTNGGEALFGLGNLADLSDLFETYRADLFAKNIRMYLARQASKPTSAASQIKKSLNLICDGKMAAEQFAMTHNGITLSVRRTSNPVDGYVTLEPGLNGVHVLNGCQTVYTAWMFFKERLAKQSQTAWRERWSSIQVPMRIIVSNDDDLIRVVTIGANRQTEMHPSAFWAHDTIQLDLERRFRLSKVYYERQQGAWDSITRSDTMKVEQFANGVVRIEELARVIAAADRTQSLGFAKSPNRIFEDETAYKRVFKTQNLVSIRLLLFLVTLRFSFT